MGRLESWVGGLTSSLGGLAVTYGQLIMMFLEGDNNLLVAVSEFDPCLGE